jgi:hypothetical protein
MEKGGDEDEEIGHALNKDNVGALYQFPCKTTREDAVCPECLAAVLPENDLCLDAYPGGVGEGHGRRVGAACLV